MKFKLNKKSLIALLILVVLLVAGWVLYSFLNPKYTVSGKFTESDSGKAVKGVVLKYGENEAKTSSDGVYEISNLQKNAQIDIVAPKTYQKIKTIIDYDKATKTSWRSKAIKQDYALLITTEEKQKRLTADITEIYENFKFAKWGDVYDAMVSDSKKVITRDAYIALMEDSFAGYTVTDYKFGRTKYLDKWTFESSKVEHKDVAEVDISLIVQALGIGTTINQSAHFVKEDGSWRWFYAGS